MIAGPDSQFESLLHHDKRIYLLKHFPEWFHKGFFNCDGFFAWARTQPAALRNTLLQGLEPDEVAQIISQLGIWSRVWALEQTHNKSIHAFLEEMLPFWHEDGKFDVIGFDSWYQRAKFMDAEIVYKHLSISEHKAVLNLWSLQLNKKGSLSFQGMESETTPVSQMTMPKFLAF